ncbi:hypothetical protein ACFCX4_24520 [Kitasatospora sp. NPDC056327]|uniref:hypothetical protein n=1 Tax=Kitasatospora sp. NPDC056327 TaxID=3345785 RepID=UPI0035DD3BEF
MRAPVPAPAPSTRRRRRARTGGPLAAVLGALVLAGAAAFGATGSATAQPAPVELIRNGDFTGPLARGWSCEGEFVELERGVEGRPSADSYASCTQTVTVVPGTYYPFYAYVSGAYTFVTISDTGLGKGVETLWANGPEEKALATTIRVGDVREVRITFHGWYGQAPYRVSRVSMIGPMYPSGCESPTPGPTSTPGSPAPTSTKPCLPRPTTPPTGPGLPTPPPATTGA